jgi:hypothetical protein
MEVPEEAAGSEPAAAWFMPRSKCPGQGDDTMKEVSDIDALLQRIAVAQKL